jgi:hypothetical protein
MTEGLHSVTYENYIAFYTSAGRDLLDNKQTLDCPNYCQLIARAHTFGWQDGILPGTHTLWLQDLPQAGPGLQKFSISLNRIYKASNIRGCSGPNCATGLANNRGIWYSTYPGKAPVRMSRRPLRCHSCQCYQRKLLEQSTWERS